MSTKIKMAITKEKKKEIVKNLTEIFSRSKSVVFVNFHKLKVAEASALRQALKNQGVSYRVAKKTLVDMALGTINPKGEKPILEGELSLAYPADGALSNSSEENLIAPARNIYDFQKKLDHKISILGGVFDGAYKSKETMLEIAAIPPLNILRAQFLNIINSPVQRLVMGIKQIADKL